MRIEGTYLFPAPVEHVFDALLAPALLKRIIPNGERLIQLGPPEAGGVSYEARIRLPEGPAIVNWHVLPVRRPAGLRLTLRGRLPDGLFTGTGTVDLVEREMHTRAAYTLDLDLPAAASDSGAGIRAAIAELCERLAAATHEVIAADAEVSSLSPGDGVRIVKTRHGRIVALSASRAGAAPWGERALWLSAGLALGVVAISLALALAHRLNGHDT